MHFHLSGNAASDLKIVRFEDFSGSADAFRQHWYVHRVTMQRRKHVIVMEESTRYALLFCRVTQPFFKNFPEFFADTLWRHIVSLCAVPTARFGSIQAMTTDMCSENIYHKGLNRSVQAHIRDSFLTLECYLLHEPPINLARQEDVFQMNIRINETPRTRYGEKNYIWSLREFQRLWCEHLGVAAVRG
ncbi:hypothetical protein Dde_2866 [Oleidesulfovibrio alaskensis G20]|uniref:DUF6933 domain-containing protein n=1 Tax=Oleidesulfovibrio alaskensis (strain ATCC BAA-1058 / DSM 17464 / G20) TaxID=207559 RepID=Q30XD5_OLEA2|nr:hypothetical protein [Oleidesulfovibrio alaskensis]ABB39661.2 hypothetical protein Dde_2866 [Oleidesulfovibrio alaskensis G20]